MLVLRYQPPCQSSRLWVAYVSGRKKHPSIFVWVVRKTRILANLAEGLTRSQTARPCSVGICAAKGTRVKKRSSGSVAELPFFLRSAFSRRARRVSVNVKCMGAWIAGVGVCAVLSTRTPAFLFCVSCGQGIIFP